MSRDQISSKNPSIIYICTQILLMSLSISSLCNNYIHAAEDNKISTTVNLDNNFKKDILEKIKKLTYANEQIIKNNVDLQEKLKRLSLTNQKIGVFNKNSIFSFIMEEDAKFLKETNYKQKNILQEKVQQLRQLESEFQIEKSSLTKELIEEKRDEISKLSISLQNLEKKFNAEMEILEKEVQTRFGAIINSAIQIFINTNKGYICFLVIGDSLIFPNNATKWPLEVSEITDKLTVLAKRSYYKKSDKKQTQAK